MTKNLAVRIMGEVKIREENDGVTLSCQGLEYSETPVTQERVQFLVKMFSKFRCDDPSMVIEYVLDESCDIHGVLEAWREGEYDEAYIAWLKRKFENYVNTR